MFKKKIFIILNILIGLFISSLILFEAFLAYKIASFPKLDETKDYNYAVILGAGLYGSKPSPILQERLDTGLLYLKDHPNTKVIVSGGQGPNEDIPESEAMKNFLVSNGINKDRVFQEDKSKSTFQNLEFSNKILKEHNNTDKILIITSDFHLFRAMEIADYLHINNAGLPSKTPIIWRIQYMLREYPAMIKLLLQEAFLNTKDII